MGGGVDAAVGLGGKECLLALVALGPVYSLAVDVVILDLLAFLGIVAVAAAHFGILVNDVAVSHVRYLGFGSEILHIFHPSAVKEIFLLEIHELHSCLHLYEEIEQVESRVDAPESHD